MAKSILSSDYKVGAPGASCDILRVTVDPRTGAGLTADLGTLVEYIGSQGSVMLCKYASWDTAWRTPGEGPLYPKTAAEFLAATKITPTALYLNDPFTGDVFDASGNGNTLTVANTPTFQQSLENKVGIFYDGATDKHSLAGGLQPGASSFLFGCEAALISDPGAAGFNTFFGLSDGGARGYIIYFNAATANCILRDNGGTLVSGIFSGSGVMANNPRLPYLLTVQCDRAAGFSRGRISRGGVNVGTFSTALGGFGAISPGGEVGFGAIPVFNGGGWSSYGYYATGAQCEGANVLRDLAVGLGWEI